MRTPSPLLFWVCIIAGHHWVMLARYSWALRVQLLVCERCRICGARRPLSLRGDYSIAR